MGDPAWILDRLLRVAKEGYRVATQISNIVDEMGKVYAEIGDIVTDLETITESVRRLRLHLNSQMDFEVRRIALQLIARCEATIADVKKSLGPLMRTSDGNINRKARIMWILSKSKIKSRRAMLESLKPTISLFMLGLEINNTGELDEYVKTEIGRLFLQLESIKVTLLDAERIDRQQALNTDLGQVSKTLEHECSDSPASTEIVESNQIIREDVDPPTDSDQLAVTRTVSLELEQSSISDSTYSADEISDYDLVQIAKQVELKDTVARFVRKAVRRKEHRDSHGFPNNNALQYESIDGYGDAAVNGNGDFEFYPQVLINDLDYELRKTQERLQERTEELERLRAKIGDEKVYSQERIQNLQAEAERIRETETNKRNLLEDEIRALKLAEEKAKAAERQREIEAQIRREVEEAFEKKMESMRVAQEEAKKEIEKAQIEAEDAARKRIEAERKAEEERARKHAEAMKEAEERARHRFEAELKAAEQARQREAEDRAVAEAQAKAKFENELRAAEEARKREAEARARTEAEAKAKFEAEMKAANAYAKAEAEAKAKFEAEIRANDALKAAQDEQKKKKGFRKYFLSTKE